MNAKQIAQGEGELLLDVVIGYEKLKDRRKR